MTIPRERASGFRILGDIHLWLGGIIFLVHSVIRKGGMARGLTLAWR
jgi:hypothetical protein